MKDTNTEAFSEVMDGRAPAITLAYNGHTIDDVGEDERVSGGGVFCVEVVGSFALEENVQTDPGGQVKVNDCVGGFEKQQQQISTHAL